MSLQFDQHTFWHAVRTDPGPAAIDTVFRGTEHFSARERMQVYRTAYWVRQVQALRELFPSVVKVLGDERFALEASRYLAAHPSQHWALELIGERFADALGASGLDEVVSRVAALDWARWCSFVAVDEPLLVALESTTLLSLELRLAAHVRWVLLDERSASVAAPLHTVTGQRLLCIWREGVELRELVVDPAHEPLLCETRAGLPFSQWCERFAELSGSAEPAALLTTLQRWVARGWLLSPHLETR